MTVVIDGGLATELEARGHDLSDRLWSARLLLTEPATIEDVHLAYFRAGAQVATTASYQATVPGFVAAGLSQRDAMVAIRRSVALARAARDRAAEEAGVTPETLWVAGSVGPYGAMLADGSEYRGDYDPGPTVLRDLHAPRMEALLEAGADMLALETIPTAREAEVLVGLVEGLGARAWLSYQCRDGTSTAAGEPIEAAVAVAHGRAGIVAVGVNCTAPRHVPELLDRIQHDEPARPVIAYPNGGDRWDPAARRWVATDHTLPAGATEVVIAAARSGVAWVGGCCGTTPTDIAAIAATLADTNEPAGREPAGS